MSLVTGGKMVDIVEKKQEKMKEERTEKRVMDEARGCVSKKIA